MKEERGSKLQMQRISNNANKHILEEALGQQLDVLCPINFKEFQLNGKKMSEALGIPPTYFKGFWPQRQPQWDGIVIGAKDKTLYLIEAKAHLSEIATGNNEPEVTNVKKKENFELKKKTLLEEKAYYGSNVDSSIWIHKYYQITNRLAFLRKLRSLSSTIGAFHDVKLVFLNFYNDPYWESKNKNVKEVDWNNKFHRIWEDLGIPENSITSNNVIVLCVDVNRLF